MTVNWSEDDEVTLYKSLMKCRPIGVHTHFRMLNIYLSLNPDLASVPRIPMEALRHKLDSLYDLPYLQSQTLAAQSGSEVGTDGEDEQQQEEAEDEESLDSAAGFAKRDFVLPYVAFHDFIEAQAVKGAESPSSPSSNKAFNATSPSHGRELRSSPTQSFKTESVAAGDEHDIDDTHAGSTGATTTPRSGLNTRKSRKRTATGAIKMDKDKFAATPTTQGKKSGSVRDSTGTPGATDDESVTGSTHHHHRTGSIDTPTTATRATKKMRTAPSRKSTRRR